MQNVILVVHILACLIVTGLVLIQKSEGGGLGIGGGGGGGAGSLMSGRGAAGALVRSTIMFAGIFFVTSLALTIRCEGA
ncbi:MAG TPA: preprotein translocase subunit SecG, partial [Hyphomonas sp.]|nr:preprotein translocase subunit SecG [Hyphomonas sp.]